MPCQIGQTYKAATMETSNLFTRTRIERDPERACLITRPANVDGQGPSAIEGAPFNVY